MGFIFLLSETPLKSIGPKGSTIRARFIFFKCVPSRASLNTFTWPNSWLSDHRLLAMDENALTISKPLLFSKFSSEEKEKKMPISKTNPNHPPPQPKKKDRKFCFIMH